MTDSLLDPLKPPTPEDIQAWALAWFKQGLDRLGAQAHLALAMIRILTRQAVELCLDGKGPAGVLGDPSQHVEAELIERSRGILKGLPPEEEHLLQQNLEELLVIYGDLAVLSEWLQRDRKGAVRFSDPTIAVTLLGDALSEGHPQAAALRGQLMRDAAWGQAAWLAVLQGDGLGDYLTLLEGETDPLWILSGVVVICQALGGAPDGTQVTESMRRAFSMGLAALVWLAPVWADRSYIDGRLEEDSPLYLPFDDWHRCIACLARFSRLLGRDVTDLDQVWRTPPQPLRNILTALALPARLSEEEARAVCVHCAPEAGAAQGWMKEPFWRLSEDVYRLMGPPEPRWHLYWRNRFLGQNWLRMALPVLAQAHPDYARIALACPGENQPALYLIRDAELAPLWIKLWSDLARSPDANLAASAWSQVMIRRPEVTSVQDFLLHKAPEMLRASGVWEQAVRAFDDLIDGNQFLFPLLRQDDPSAIFVRKTMEMLQIPISRIEQLLRSLPAHYPQDIEQLVSMGVAPSFLMRRLLEKLKPEWSHASTLLSVEAQSLLGLLNLGDPQVFTLLLEAISSQQPQRGQPPALAVLLGSYPPGAWLDALLAWLRKDRPDGADSLLRRLAQHSEHAEVRRRCLLELLA